VILENDKVVKHQCFPQNKEATRFVSPAENEQSYVADGRKRSQTDPTRYFWQDKSVHALSVILVRA
jgi:D-serine dehydratase